MPVAHIFLPGEQAEVCSLLGGAVQGEDQPYVHV